ncbi:MAG TPA: hypothetical protein VF660_11050 [Actinomycetota bacterium]|jgi:hypothetical protein
MIRRVILIVGAVALVVLGASSALATAKATLSPGQTFKWKVAGFKTPTATPAACPPSVDSRDVLCSHVIIGVAPVDWSKNTGALKIAISFSSSNDFNLYVFKASDLVRSSEGSNGGSESVTIPNPTGTYEIRVVPVQIATSLLQGGAGYSGMAGFLAQPKPVTVKQPSGAPNLGLPIGTSPTQPRSPAPRYQIPSTGGYAGYPAYGGSYSPGGLFQGPSYSGGGGGTVSGSKGSSPGQLYYQSAYGGPVTRGVPQRVAESTRDVAVGSTVARAPKALWLLLPLALLLLGGVAYLVVEPEGRAEAIAETDGEWAEIPSRVALGGMFIKSIAGLARATVIARRWIADRFSSSD